MRVSDKTRIEELERRVRDLEAQPREIHIHQPSLPVPITVQPWPWTPAPVWPYHSPTIAPNWSQPSFICGNTNALPPSFTS